MDRAPTGARPDALRRAAPAEDRFGATAIVTGVSAEVAQALIGLGVDVQTLNAVGDLQGGIERAERLLPSPALP